MSYINSYTILNYNCINLVYNIHVFAHPLTKIHIPSRIMQKTRAVLFMLYCFRFFYGAFSLAKKKRVFSLFLRITYHEFS